MSQQPSIGRIVHYHGPGTANAEAPGQFPATTYAATVTAVHGEKCVSLFVMTTVGHMNLSSVMLSEDGAPGTWSWPPRV